MKVEIKIKHLIGKVEIVNDHNASEDLIKQMSKSVESMLLAVVNIALDAAEKQEKDESKKPILDSTGPLRSGQTPQTGPSIELKEVERWFDDSLRNALQKERSSTQPLQDWNSIKKTLKQIQKQIGELEVLLFPSKGNETTSLD